LSIWSYHIEVILDKISNQTRPKSRYLNKAGVLKCLKYKRLYEEMSSIFSPSLRLDGERNIKTEKREDNYSFLLSFDNIVVTKLEHLKLSFF